MLSKSHFEQNNDLSLEDDAEDKIEDRIEALTELKNIKDDGFNIVNWNIAIDHCIEEDKDGDLKELHGLLSAKAAKTLAELASTGPLEDGDYDKGGREELVELNLIERIASKGKFGPWAANGRGFYLWKAGGDDKSKDDEGEEDDG